MPGFWRPLVAIIAASWSLFQLAVAAPFLIDSGIVRSIHLAFGLLLVWLCTPALREDGWLGCRVAQVPGLGFLVSRRRPSIGDAVCGVIAAIAATYPVWDVEAMARRAGAPSALDLTMGVTLLVLLLEATRRGLGLALALIAIIFMISTQWSQQLPLSIAFASPSLERVLERSVSNQGIFGTPLDVVASTVFLFVLFGAMLERSGAGAWFINVALAVVGRFRGGSAKAAILASGLSGTVSGSSIANVVTTGAFTIPLMRRGGYDANRAGAIEVAASTNGQLMPPVMGAAAFIIAEYCGLPYVAVITAAAVPAGLSYLALLWIAHGEACRLGLAGIPRAELPRLWSTVRAGLPFLVPLLVLGWALVIERWSPRLAAFWAIVTLAAVQWLRAMCRRSGHRQALIDWFKEMGAGLVAGGRTMAPIAVAVGCAGIIVGVVTMGMGGALVGIIEWLSGGNLMLMLVLVALTCMILGLGLPTTANYIVVAGLMAPAIVILGPDAGLVVPLIAAHLFVFYFGILADDTPPVGLAAYAAAAISGGDPIRTGLQGFIYDLRTAALPFAFIVNHDLLLIGVTSFAHGALVISTGLLGMMAFASATMGWMFATIRWPGRILLLIAAALLLRPDLITMIGLDRPWGFVIGAVLVPIAWLISRVRSDSTLPESGRSAEDKV